MLQWSVDDAYNSRDHNCNRHEWGKDDGAGAFSRVTCALDCLLEVMRGLVVSIAPSGRLYFSDGLEEVICSTFAGCKGYDKGVELSFFEHVHVANARSLRHVGEDESGLGV